MSNTVGIPQATLDQLDPEYLVFIPSSGKTLQPHFNEFQWAPAFRQSGPLTDRGNSEPMEVMAPPGERPDRGWPMILYAHRGGWVLGDAGAEDEMLNAQCVTVSVDYRLAPKHPFPAGLDDVWNALNWLSKEVYQALITPVIDASFSADDRSWWTPSITEHEDNWDLTVLEMLRFRDLYLPNVHDRTKPDASPCYQENRLAFEGMPPTWISIAEVDTLRSEGEMYAEKLRTYGVSVTLKILKGLPHTGIKCDRVCGQVRRHHDELAKALQKAIA
ncbi:unnamed protein product [Rhizoctonia solani]|uniref:Alpha/beta hydrolase fold-3 domain-containing protein n=1 Tax=Rhizoctonia solani TaxID=456999 RepID=A0A8H3H419_9AGAM|nr:unnamed protein product [Rhizoctonia solani]